MRNLKSILSGSILRNCWRQLTAGANVRTASTNAGREISADQTTEDKKSTVVMSDDGRVVVCWHPEVPFPYEMTKPLPMESLPTDNVLKVQAIRPIREMYRSKNDRILVQELMALTHTPKYVWYPKQRRKLMRKQDKLDVERDREFL